MTLFLIYEIYNETISINHEFKSRRLTQYVNMYAEYVCAYIRCEFEFFSVGN